VPAPSSTPIATYAIAGFVGVEHHGSKLTDLVARIDDGI
jgi:hypothetical protein